MPDRRNPNEISPPVAPDELELAADRIIKAAAVRAPRAARVWAIHSNADMEAVASVENEDGDERRSYAQWLRAQGDPRGELAHLSSVGESVAAKRHLRRHASLLFGDAARRIALGHIVIDAWRFGFVDRAHARLDKVNSVELRAFARCPAARFLSSLTLSFTDESDDPKAKVYAGRMHIEGAIALLRNAPCADSLRVLHVRSIDPAGQPDLVLAEKSAWSRTALRGLRQLVECRLSFDSDP